MECDALISHGAAYLLQDRLFRNSDSYSLTGTLFTFYFRKNLFIPVRRFISSISSLNPDPDNYFADYENFEVHVLMLRDRPRQDAYQNAILSNAALFKVKTVLDVGAGTGILSALQRKGKHQGFCIWLDCRFPCDSYEYAITLSTSPCESETHWKQCVVVLPEKACQQVDVGTPIVFDLSMKRNPNDQRKFNIEVELLDPEEEPSTLSA